jgi:HK97 family phage major capsid protein
MYNSSDMIVPASTNVDRSIVALFGNWKYGYVIVDRMGMSVQRLNELYAESGQVGFLFHARVGGGVVRSNAFRALNNNT